MTTTSCGSSGTGTAGAPVVQVMAVAVALETTQTTPPIWTLLYAVMVLKPVPGEQRNEDVSA